MKIAFRVDSSKNIGTGHVMRCVSFARKLSRDGAECIFVCRDLECNIISQIIEQDFDAILLPKSDSKCDNLTPHANWLETSQENDALETIEVLKNYSIDWVIVDHYAISKEWEQIVQEATKAKIFIIDDLADRKHMCDILLDQNFYINMKSRYSKLVPNACKMLLGPEHLLIKDEFYTYQKSQIKDDIGFVFFGGIDSYGLTLKTLNILIDIGFTNKINVVCGSNNPDITEIETLCSMHKNLKLHINTKEMAQIISESSFGIAAGGVNTWERCVLGLPTLVFSIAKNQEQISIDCDKVGFCKYAGGVENCTKDVIELFVVNQHLKNDIHQKCLEYFRENKFSSILRYFMN